MKRTIAEAITEELAQAFPAAEARVVAARRLLSEAVVPQMNALIAGLQSGDTRISDIYLDEGANHALLHFGGRPNPGGSPQVPPKLRFAVTSDGYVDLAYNTGWFGNQADTQFLRIAPPATDTTEVEVWKALFAFVTEAELAYYKARLVSG